MVCRGRLKAEARAGPWPGGSSRIVMMATAVSHLNVRVWRRVKLYVLPPPKPVMVRLVTARKAYVQVEDLVTSQRVRV